MRTHEFQAATIASLGRSMNDSQIHSGKGEGGIFGSRARGGEKTDCIRTRNSHDRAQQPSAGPL